LYKLLQMIRMVSVFRSQVYQRKFMFWNGLSMRCLLLVLKLWKHSRDGCWMVLWHTRTSHSNDDSAVMISAANLKPSCDEIICVKY